MKVSRIMYPQPQMGSCWFPIMNMKKISRFQWMEAVIFFESNRAPDSLTLWPCRPTRCSPIWSVVTLHLGFLEDLNILFWNKLLKGVEFIFIPLYTWHISEIVIGNLFCWCTSFRLIFVIICNFAKCPHFNKVHNISWSHILWHLFYKKTFVNL